MPEIQDFSGKIVGGTGFEPMTFWMSTRRSDQLS